jgi:phage protein U
MSVFKYHKPGIGNASSYVVSGIPWHTSSVAPPLSTTSTVVNLPRVTNYVTVKNTSTTEDVLRFTFNRDNIVDNTNYITLENGESFSAQLRVTDIHLISDNETPVPFSIIAGLTNIERQEMSSVTPTAPNLLAWVQKQNLQPGPPDEDPAINFFGGSLSLANDGDLLAVGALVDLPSFLGSAYIFKNVNGVYEQTQRVSASGVPTSSQFGDELSFSSDGRILAVGAWVSTSPPTGDDRGSVYIFESGSSGYEEKQRITASYSDAGAFGYALKVNSDGSKLFIGAYGDDEAGSDAGAVYVFESSSLGYQQVQKLTASGDLNPANDQFGGSLSINETGNILAIGAPYDEENGGSSAGSAYIFQSSSLGYQQVQKLIATDPDGSPQGDRFGISSALNTTGNTIVIGAYQDEENGTNSGCAYVFQSSSLGYQQVQKITASVDVGGGLLGSSVSISSDNRIISIGSQGDDTSDTNAGAVLLFESGSGGYQQIEKFVITGEDTNGANLGTNVEINSSGNIVVAGAEFSNENGFFAGTAYVFRYTRDY